MSQLHTTWRCDDGSVQLASARRSTKKISSNQPTETSEFNDRQRCRNQTPKKIQPHSAGITGTMTTIKTKGGWRRQRRKNWWSFDFGNVVDRWILMSQSVDLVNSSGSQFFVTGNYMSQLHITITCHNFLSQVITCHNYTSQ